MNRVKSVIFGCSGLALTDAERAFFAETNPLGLIIFDRNVKNPEQLKQLIADFRSCVGRKNAPVLVDQEGGRVTRLWPPFWTGLGPARTYGDLFDEDAKKGIAAVKKHAITLAKDLSSVGIDVDCWPCLDVATPLTHEIMTKRCFSDKADVVMELAQTAVKTMLENGLMPVIKHIPGYGHATVDPHADLPVVTTDIDTLKQTDFKPFTAIKDPVWGMTAHVIYDALDKKLPATLSPTVVGYIRSVIGFNSFLISDDMSMGALTKFGSAGEVAGKMIKAGVDCVLHCNGHLMQMKEVAVCVPTLSVESQKRLDAAELLRASHE